MSSTNPPASSVSASSRTCAASTIQAAARRRTRRSHAHSTHTSKRMWAAPKWPSCNKARRRPGVPTTTWQTLCRRATSACIGRPPTKAQHCGTQGVSATKPWEEQRNGAALFTCTASSRHRSLTVRCTWSATSRVGSTMSACVPGTSALMASATMMPNVTVLPVPDLACVAAREAACASHEARRAGARLDDEVCAEAAQRNGSLLNRRRLPKARPVQAAHEHGLAPRATRHAGSHAPCGRALRARTGSSRSAKDAAVPCTSAVACRAGASGGWTSGITTPRQPRRRLG
jgi:hypothetical protein